MANREISRSAADRIRFGSILIGALLSSMAGGLTAQAVTGNIQGRIVDQFGQPAAGMSLMIDGPDLQGQRSTRTGGDGFFQVLALPPGSYTVRLQGIGLRPVLIRAVQVALGRTTNLGQEGISQYPDGRWLVKWESHSVRLNEKYIIEWDW